MNNAKHTTLDFIVSGFYSGHAKAASGTVGTIAAVTLILILWMLFPTLFSPFGGLLFALGMTVLAVFTSNLALELELYGAGNKDPQRIVIDEFAGMCWALVALPISPVTLALSFFFFRLFDTTKPPPARNLEKLPRGWGIVMDDVAAGIMANIVVQLLLLGFQ
jgi:phosphatidylglycerophosphatase A